jgi:hypothetical protein
MHEAWENRVWADRRVTGWLEDAALDNDITAYRRNRAAELGVILRMSGVPDPYTEYITEAAAPRAPRRLEDYGYGESTPDGCPPCDRCHYICCRCG